MRSKSSSKKYLSKAVTVVTFIFILLFVSIIPILLGFFFAIEEVQIISDKKSSTINGIGDFKNRNLIWIDPQNVNQYLKERNPIIKEVRVKKKYPRTLGLVISFYNPVAAIDGGEGYLVLSEDATIISKSKEKNSSFPLINYYQKVGYSSYHVGDKIDHTDTLTALYFIEKTKELGLIPVTVDIDSLDMIALNLKDKRVLFTSKKEKKLQLYQLETILRQFKIQGRDYSQMDLRFDKPVIKF